MSPGKRKRKTRRKDDFVARVVSNFQAAVPDWPLLMFMGLITAALKSLRHYIESEDAPEASWENPFAELQYPARWDWKKSQVILLEEPDQKQAKENEEEFLNSVYDYHIAQVFWALTGGGALYREGSEVFPLLDQETWDIIDALPQGSQNEKMAELYRPFVIGLTPLRGERESEEDEVGSPVASQPGSISEEQTDIDSAGSGRERLRERIEDAQKLGFSYNIGDRTIAGGLVFAFQPLMVNADEHRAYYPVFTGLVFDERDTALQMSRSEQAEFWGRLLQQCDDICSSTLPDESDEEAELLSIVLEDIEKTIYPVYQPWITGIHGLSLAYLKESGELPALRLPCCRVPQEADQDDASIDKDAASGEKIRIVINLRASHLTICGKIVLCNSRVLDAAAFALKRQQGGPHELGKNYFDRVELCNYLEADTQTKIRDIFRNTPFYTSNRKTRLVKKYKKVKNAYYLDIDIKNSHVED